MTSQNMDCPYNEIFSVGDHLILELTSNDIFEGDFIEGGKNQIDLINTRQHNNPNELGGTYSFYRSEIRVIRKPKVNPTVKPYKNIIKDLDECNQIKIVEEEYERLKLMAKNFIYLENADSRYYDAVKRLSESETIGVVSLGMVKNRSAVLKLLVLCTWQQVYLFDMINVKNRTFYSELKDIFESEHICKVVHNGSLLADILFRNYKVFVRNIFDTQIVDLIIQKNRAGKTSSMEARSISDCLVVYLNFPSSLLKSALEVTTKTWYERPLGSMEKSYASQLGTYLIILKEAMHKVFFSEVIKCIDNIYDYHYSLEDYELSQKIDNIEDIDKLIPNFTQFGIQGNSKDIDSQSQ